MRLDYKKIFKQAWLLARNHKFLWAYGLLLFLGNPFNLSYSFSDSTPPAQQISSEPIMRWAQSNQSLAGWLGLAALVLLVILVIIYFRAKAGSIIATKLLLENKDTSIYKSFQASKLFYLRLAGLTFLLGAILVGLTLIVLYPIAHVLSTGSTFQIIILSILGLCVLVPAFVVATLANIIAPLFVVIFDLKIREAMMSSFDLAAKYWIQLAPLFLFLAILMVGGFVAGAMLASLASSPFVFLAILTYHKIGLAGTFAVWAAAFFIGSIVFLTVQSLVAIFAQTSWIIAFLELVKPQKLEEEEPLAVPEIAS